MAKFLQPAEPQQHSEEPAHLTGPQPPLRTRSPRTAPPHWAWFLRTHLRNGLRLWLHFSGGHEETQILRRALEAFPTSPWCCSAPICFPSLSLHIFSSVLPSYTSSASQRQLTSFLEYEGKQFFKLTGTSVSPTSSDPSRGQGLFGKADGSHGWNRFGLNCVADQHVRPRGILRMGGVGEWGKALWGWVGDERGCGGMGWGDVVSHLGGKAT